MEKKNEIEIEDGNCRWNYKIEYNKENIPNIIVEPDPKLNKKTPKLLSKYYAINSNNVSAFLNQEIYVSQPDQFNDKFDFNPYTLNFSSFEFRDFESILKNTNLIKEEEDYNKDPERYKNSIRDTIFLTWIQLHGFYCVTKNKYNDLMWAHYTQNEGFLIEFDFSKFTSYHIGPLPINYIQKKSFVNLARKYDTNLLLFVEGLTKKKIWNYEEEFRVFFLPQQKDERFEVSGLWSNSKFDFKKVPRLIPYPKDAISKVIFGFDFFGNNVIKRLGNHHNIIDFKGENSILKASLLQKLIDDGIYTELIIQDINKYELRSNPLEIKHLTGTKFEIIQDRTIIND